MACLFLICFCELDYTLSVPIFLLHSPGSCITISSFTCISANRRSTVQITQG